MAFLVTRDSLKFIQARDFSPGYELFFLFRKMLLNEYGLMKSSSLPVPKIRDDLMTNQTVGI